jgi:acetyltransferase-like isoleucine patch superfamily enzyme
MKIERLRFVLLRFKHDCEIHDPAYIARSAKFDFQSDGYNLGGRVRIAAGARISHGAVIAPYGGHITIGRNFYLGPGCVLYGHGGLTIGDDVLIAAHTVIVPSNHRFMSRSVLINKQGADNTGIKIGNDVWIGAGAKILDGAHLDDGAVVAAGAVVNRPVEEYSLVAGVPARKLKYRSA